MNQPTWHDIVRERQRRDDESVARKFAPYRNLVRGHMQQVQDRY